MPVIVVSRRDLERLVGRSLTYEEIFDYLTRLKCEVEKIGEDVIEYEATHDRPDLFSVEGLARAIRIMNGEKQSFEFIDENIVFYNKGVPYRPYVAFAIVKNIVLDDEAIKQIMQLQEKLASIYGRKRRKASIGVYDFDKFKIPIYYELADPMETRFIPLDYNEEMNLLEILEKTEKGREYGWIIRDYD
ncbi:MAG: phenylalanine--tRNA ligase subunit beta, partial [Desulfurococcaceae archaeon]